MATRENVRNAPLAEPKADPTQSNFAVPKVPTLDTESFLDQTLKYNQLGAQQALQTSKSAQDQTTQAGLNAKIANQRLDNSMAINNSQIQTPLQQRQAGLFGGGGSFQGNAAFNGNTARVGDGTTTTGQRGIANQVDSNRQFQDQQNQSLTSTALFGRAGAEGDIYKAQQLANIANGTSQQNQNRSIDLMNRQNSINSQNSGNDYLRLAQQNAQDRISRERVAATQAQSNVYSSLLGSVGVGGSNYRYWS
jgi:hypothetical protein